MCVRPAVVCNEFHAQGLRWRPCMVPRLPLSYEHFVLWIRVLEKPQSNDTVRQGLTTVECPTYGRVSPPVVEANARHVA